MSDRVCGHEFYCWYRLEGRCCHSSVEDVSKCKGQEPSWIYVELTIRPGVYPPRGPAQETDGAAPRGWEKVGILAAG
jgi:hypothetical protein